MKTQHQRAYDERMGEWHIGMAEQQVARLWRGSLQISYRSEVMHAHQRNVLEQVRRLRRRIDQWRAQLDECRNKRIETTQRSRAKSRHKELPQEIADDDE